MYIRILGTGSTIPGIGNQADPDYCLGRCVDNNEVGELVGYSADQVFEKTGIKTRWYFQQVIEGDDHRYDDIFRQGGFQPDAPGENKKAYFYPRGQNATALALSAANRALRKAGVRAEDLDHVVYLTMSPDYLTPMAGDFLMHLGAVRAGLTCINAACAAFPWGVRQACGQIATGDKLVLVVYIDVMSQIIDVGSDNKGQMLFGDAAGAVVFGACAPGEGMILPNFYQITQTDQFDQIRQYRAAEILVMETPHMIARWANRQVPAAIRAYCSLAGISLDEIDWLLLHQANKRILEKIVGALKFPPEKVPSNIERYGNTSAASIPILLDELVRAGELRNGQLVVCAGFGAGLNIGICAFRWHDPPNPTA